MLNPSCPPLLISSQLLSPSQDCIPYCTPAMKKVLGVKSREISDLGRTMVLILLLINECHMDVA